MKHLKYFFFSDSHIADGTGKDDFSQDFRIDMKFLEKMQLIKSKVDMIVGVGDLFELWQTSANKIINAHFLVYKFLMQYVKRLKGNHDFSMFAPQSMAFTTKSGKRVKAIHAHQSNKKMTAWYSIAGMWIVGKLERWVPWLDNPKQHPKLYMLLPKKWRAAFKKKYVGVPGIVKDVEKYAKTFIGKVDIMIVGHTHIQGVKVLKNGKGSILLLNCGNCTGGKVQGILFDANTDKHIFL